MRLPKGKKLASSVCGRSTSLRDQLAIDRTVLANERTLLAYMRTGLALLVVGGSLIRFFDSPGSALTGWLFVAGGAMVTGIGALRYLSVRRQLHPLIDRIARVTEDNGLGPDGTPEV